jgi:hypothetical protein
LLVTVIVWRIQVKAADGITALRELRCVRVQAGKAADELSDGWDSSSIYHVLYLES